MVPTDVHPLQPISGPCSIEKYPSLGMEYPSSRMANRYTCIFDAGGQNVTFSIVSVVVAYIFRFSFVCRAGHGAGLLGFGHGCSARQPPMVSSC